MNARVIKLHKRASLFRGLPDEAKIRRQIVGVRPFLSEIDPRENLHLDSTKVSLHRERLEAWRRGEHVAPITIDMALTQKCSYSCTFCYAGLQQNPQSPVPWEVYDRFLEDCSGIGVKGISLVSDGESTENPDFLKFILKAKAVGIDVAVGTNGLKLTNLNALVENLTYLRINFNAADPVRYSKIMGASPKSYETVIENIRQLVALKKLTRSNITIGLQQVLLPEYADEVLPMAVLGRELKVDYLVIKHCSDDESGSLGVDYGWYRTPLAQELLETAEGLSTPTYSVQAKWRKLRTGRDREYSRCLGPPLFLQLSGSGVVAPCGSFFSEKYNRFHIGDLKTQTFKEIWNSPEYREVMGHLASDQFDPRKECAALCVQDSTNLALYNWVNGAELPGAAVNSHINFV